MTDYFTQNYGIEDFQLNRVNNRVNPKDFDMLNKLKLLGALKANKTADEFGAESTNLFNEVKRLNDASLSIMSNIGTAVKTARNVAAAYGIEGFDPLAFGAEDFTSKLKDGFKTVAAAIKKLVQVVTNFLGRIKAFIGSKLAKLQESVYEKYKDSDTKNGIAAGSTVKFAKPNDKVISDPLIVFTVFTESMIGAGKIIDNANKDLLSKLSSRYVNGTTVINKDEDKIFDMSRVEAAYGELSKFIKTTKKFKIAKIGSSTRFAYTYIYGNPDAKKIAMSSKTVFDMFTKSNSLNNWIGEESTKKLVKAEVTARETLKCLNNSIKSFDAILKNMQFDKYDKDTKYGYNLNNSNVIELKSNTAKSRIKSYNKENKKALKAYRQLTSINRVYSLLVGTEIAMFNEILHIRAVITKLCKQAMKIDKTEDMDDDDKRKIRAQARKSYYGEKA